MDEEGAHVEEQPEIGTLDSPSQMDVVATAVEDPILLEDDIRKAQRLDTVSIISSLRITSSDLSRMKIPLCRLIPMPMVRPTLSCDLKLLENQFIHGYEEGARVFYVSISNEEGQSGIFSATEKEEWGPLWNSVNDEFNEYLKSQAVLKHLVDFKFYVCDGNHRRLAWMSYIQSKHPNDRNWHISVDSIVLDTGGRIGVAMQVMHDVNK